jgi:LMBR1 domain-containing protein 1
LAAFLRLFLFFAEQGLDVSESGSYFSRRASLKSFGKDFNEFRVGVLTIERDYEIFKLELNIVNTNPVVWVLKLICGILFFIISFVWWLHMYKIKPIFVFLVPFILPDYLI